VSSPDDDGLPGWWKVLYLFGWVTLWFFAAVVMLMCIFGCLVYYW